MGVRALLKLLEEGLAGDGIRPSGKAAEIYERDASRDVETNWPEIAKKIYPEYLALALELRQIDVTNFGRRFIL